MNNKPSIFWLAFCLIFSIVFLHKALFSDISFSIGLPYFISGTCLLLLGLLEVHKFAKGEGAEQ